MIDDFMTDDLDDATALFRAVFNDEPWNDAWDLRSARIRLADVLATLGGLGVCRRLDGRLRGFALGHAEQWFTGRHFFVKEMCVETAEQRRGYRSPLLSALERRLVGIELVYLLTSKEGAAEKLYLRNGFRTASRPHISSRHCQGPRWWSSEVPAHGTTARTRLLSSTGGVAFRSVPP